ncbi:flagellar transcriptional regulator FlhD [uncultured Castellaniella sp.]|jgi:flagellar transcriptional activator FlhD|uniref:flagellar transcriptional regulator FlhD n=1 Tax=uncultured Castellaniella sp. TaxID=647907 RepID=UPI002633EA33|nr:flagellar transcriptional regulator FlhD [uncultured Castellaniella sp.]
MSDIDSALLDDIREVNLSYLMLAQRLLRENLAAGMFRLGFGTDVAEIILNLSPAQIVKLASSNSVLCAFRLNDAQLLNSLTHEVLGGVLQQAHSTILMSRQEALVA